MGHAVARHVLDAGGTAVITGRSQTRTEEAAAALSAHGTASGLAADLTDPAARSAENQVSDVLVGSHSGPAPARSSAGSNRHSGLNRRPTASLGSVASRLSRNP
ncbi:hypothetical protein ACFYUM_12445 [Streptomyces fimicarius]|uniref:hypothetical protein n=1 Tax=Streptomyces griseus TaxID=1911 RepID=UPI00369A4B92